MVTDFGKSETAFYAFSTFLCRVRDRSTKPQPSQRPSTRSKRRRIPYDYSTHAAISFPTLLTDRRTFREHRAIGCVSTAVTSGRFRSSVSRTVYGIYERTSAIKKGRIVNTYPARVLNGLGPESYRPTARENYADERRTWSYRSLSNGTPFLDRCVTRDSKKQPQPPENHARLLFKIAVGLCTGDADECK